MCPNIIRKRPVSAGSYVPYIFESGLYESYFQPSSVMGSIAHSWQYGRYEFSSDPSHVHPLEHRPTVEQIIARGYFAPPRGEPESALLSDKHRTSWLGLESVISQIKRRYEICERNLCDIELGKCAAMNAVFTREADLGFVSRDSREIYSMNKVIQGLYEQQRDERVNLWRDVSRLKEGLPETAQQYLANYRKVSILEDSRGDGN